jgi:hypothetical protein
MIYDGMDGQLFNIALPHASALGLTMRPAELRISRSVQMTF